VAWRDAPVFSDRCAVARVRMKYFPATRRSVPDDNSVCGLAKILLQNP
jgi:hypothetical protein